MKFVVLGGYGIIGKAVVSDLFKYTKDEIIIAGRDLAKAKKYAASFKSSRVLAKEIDITNERQTVDLLKGSDVCVNCVQYYYNVQIMKYCLKAKTNYVDLGGLFHETKKQLKLDGDFKKIGKIAILGIGGTPGITNVMAAYAARLLKKFKSIDITFADVDYANKEFALPYSFKTIVDEFTMKPAVLKNGKLIFANPGSGEKEYDFGKEFGKQKGFYTLHSELATFPESFDKNGLKNCEFRVTFDQNFSRKIKKLIETGFTSSDLINFGGKEFKIIDITDKIMEKFSPKLGNKNDKELLRVNLDNKIIMDAVAKSDGDSSWIVDTGIPCSIAAQMIAQKRIVGSGVLAPEKAINPMSFFMELRRRGIKIFRNKKEVK